MNKYNVIVRIGNGGEGNTNISFVSPDHQEHELMVPTDLLTSAKEWQAIPAEYWTHPACCEHPEGCPDETKTEKLLKEFNNE